MASIPEDVIRLEIPSETPTPSPIKLGMDFFSLDTKSHGHLFTDNSVEFYTPRSQYASQTGTPGTARIGDLGLPGVTPDGGSAPGDPGTLRAVLVGMLAYILTLIAAALTPAPAYDAETAYSQNQFVSFAGVIFCSKVPGTGTNTGNTPEEGGNEFWGQFGTIWDILTFILNTKADS